MDYDSKKIEQCQSSCNRNPLTEVLKKEEKIYYVYYCGSTAHNFFRVYKEKEII